MKIGDYELGPDTLFFMTGDDQLPITMNAGGDIPMTAIWINGHPKEYTLREGAFVLPCTPKGFQDLIIDSQADS